MNLFDLPATRHRLMMGAFALAAFGGLAMCIRSQRAAESPATAIDASPPPEPPSQRACPLLKYAPKPREAQPEAARQCSVIEQARASLAKGQAIADEDLKLLRARVEAAVTEQPEGCVNTLFDELRGSKDCGIVYDAISIRVVNGKAVAQERIAAELRKPSECQWKLLSSLREAEQVQPSIAAAVLDLTETKDTDVANAAWMTLGSLERIARTAAQDDMALCLDHVLGSALASADGATLDVLVKAAGNGACQECRPRIEQATKSSEPALRRAAFVALRFMTTSSDVAALCNALHHDPDASVRGSAAYALRFLTTDLEERFKCLYESAVEEEAEQVAADALGSLEELAVESPAVVGALVHVAKHSRHQSLRARAVDSLRRFASDAAIKRALSQ